MLYRGTVHNVPKEAIGSDMFGHGLDNPIFIVQEGPSALAQASIIKKCYENALVIIDRSKEVMGE